MPRTSALLGLLAFVAAGAATLPAQDTQGKVDKIFDQIEESRGAGLWDGVRELDQLGRGALEAVRKGLTRADGFVRIAAARVLYTNELREEGLDALLKVVAGKNGAAKRAAADMIASLVGSDRTLAPGERTRIAGDLRRQAGESNDPLAQVALWRAVWSLVPGMEPVRKLRDEILPGTDRRDVKEEAALALAEMGRLGDAKPVLVDLAKEPSDRGRLAKSYLRLRELDDHIQRQLGAAAGGAPPAYDFKLLEEAIDTLKKYYHDESKIDPAKLIEAATRGAASSLDPYTTYMDEAMIKQLREEDLAGLYGGIGARVSMKKDKSGHSWLTIEEPIFSGPAYRTGLRSNDTIVEIEGEKTVDKELSELVRRLRGKPGTPATIKVMRRGWPKERAFSINREQIHLETTINRMIPGGIGYLKLSTFGEQDIDLVAKAIRAMPEMKALVFDLRGNSGGYLRTAHKLAGYFLDKGQAIVSTRARGMIQDSRTAEGPKLTDVPLVILVNDTSASASEILAGALQDHKRAVLVGEKTYGKGSVQDLKFLKITGDKAAIKVTISKWYLPSGRTVEGEKLGEGGVKPDVEIADAEPDYWKVAEFERLRAGDEIDKYVKGVHERDPKLLEALAESDGGDLSRYPDFAALYASLKAKASEDEVRELVREMMRKRVQDEIRKRPLYIDLQTDKVLQRGILEACKKAGLDAAGIPEYSTFAKAPEKKDVAK